MSAPVVDENNGLTRTALRGCRGERRRRLALARLAGAACTALLLGWWLAASLGAAPLAPGPADGGIDVLHLRRGLDYRAWMDAAGWSDERPFSSSSRRFRIEDGVLRLASAQDSYLIGRQLDPSERRSIADFPYLRFVVRIEDVPRGARLLHEERDDAAFRIYAVFRDSPLQALVYVWAWELPVGAWSVRGRSFWGDFRAVHRKAFGSGEPLADTWLTVEVNLRADFQVRFPGRPLPVLGGIALKADSNHTAGGHSVAWLRSASLHAASLRGRGLREGQALGDTVLWFR